MKNDIQLKELYQKVADGTATKQERMLLNGWYNSLGAAPSKPISEERLMDVRQKMWAGIERDMAAVVGRTSFRLWQKISIAAASVILVSTIGFYLYKTSTVEQDFDQVAIENHIVPGKNGATLTLANGKKIFINDALAGNIAEESGVKISKSKDGQVVYQVLDNGSGKLEFNTLSTTLGEQTQVRLPDGSLVFLNAASSLKYPTNFAGSARREVVLTGEGYFEISKDKMHPFIVSTGKQKIEVLGTHFNINAYWNEKVVRTTLLEGSVKVSAIAANGLQIKVLKPGEQSILDYKGIQVAVVDLDEAVAWQKGYFSFYDEDIASIMRKVSRWYNIEVEYSGQLPKNGFDARINKYASITQVLNKLEKTGDVHFKMEGRKIIVSK